MGSANLHISSELVEGGGGPTINPWSSSEDPRVSGGSSGGSAVAVASHSCFGYDFFFNPYHPVFFLFLLLFASSSSLCSSVRILFCIY
jgi:hypothetical protein